LYPGLAVAERLAQLLPDSKIVFACSNRPIDRRILDPLPYPVVPQPVRPIPRGPRGWGKFILTWVRSNLQAREIIRDLRPVAVLGLGGFAAAPLVRAAAKEGIPTGLLNPDAVPGRANRFLAKRVDVIFTQFDGTRDAFPPPLQEKIRCVGCPVRGGFSGAGRDEGVRHFALREDRKTLLVLGGSLGAESINAAIAALAGDLDELEEDWQLLHITGPEKGRTPILSPTCPLKRIQTCCLEYCDRMDLAYAAADMVLSRAGAGTVAELAAASTPAVLLPYPHHRDQHQHLNALALTDPGAALLVGDSIDPTANAEALRAVLLPLLRDSVRLEDMHRAARTVVTPDAAGEVASWLAGMSKP
jgi:UDP-N-acetylglucosamine--N-acetylmuramyl-(pentapeptide) pyrophosphoryl-undecaprenol N-acetylglucosamine transferase